MSDTERNQDFRATMRHALDEERLVQLPDLLNSKRKDFEPLIVAARLDMISKPEPRRLFSFLRAAERKPPTYTKEELNWRLDNLGQFQKWILDRIGRENPILSLTGTSACWLWVSPQVLQVGTGLTWHEFITVAKMRNAMREIVHLVADLVGADEAIIAADCEVSVAQIIDTAFGEGKSYEEITQQLRRMASKSESPIESLLQNATPRAAAFTGVYFIDNFADRK